MGAGISELLKSVGASAIIEGGQTMNPSTEDIVKAIEAVGAERVLILPNNKNIIMAAEQAAEVIGIEAAVVPTKTVPEGLAAILAFNPEAEVSVNARCDDGSGIVRENWTSYTCSTEIRRLTALKLKKMTSWVFQAVKLLHQHLHLKMS